MEMGASERVFREGFQRIMDLFDFFETESKQRREEENRRNSVEALKSREKEVKIDDIENMKSRFEAFRKRRDEKLQDESDVVEEIEDSEDESREEPPNLGKEIPIEKKIQNVYAFEVAKKETEHCILQKDLMEKKEKKKKKKKKTTDEEDYTKNVEKETYRSEEIAGKDCRCRKWKGMKYWQKVRFKYSLKRKTQAIKKVKRDKMHRIHRRMKKNKRQSHRRPAKKRGRAQQVPEKKIRYSWKHLLKSICHLRKSEKKESRPLKKMKFGGGFKVEIAFAGMLTKRKKKKAMKKSCVKKRE